MDALVDLEETVHPDLRVYRWRPRGQPQTPCVYNWIDPTDFEQKDLANFQDTFELRCFVAIEHGDDEQEMASVEAYADAFRFTIDPALHRNPPLDGACNWAQRKRLYMAIDKFNQVDLQAIVFPVEVRLNRIITPS
jgi:hypothetical protein